jgi:hypothetical protein
MSEHEDEPQRATGRKGIGEDVTDSDEARGAESPEVGYPVDTTEPYGGLGGDEGKVNADATPRLADDGEKGQTATPAPADDVSSPHEREPPAQR